jgi:hypothetical protein
VARGGTRRLARNRGASIVVAGGKARRPTFTRSLMR